MTLVVNSINLESMNSILKAYVAFYMVDIIRDFNAFILYCVSTTSIGVCLARIPYSYSVYILRILCCLILFGARKGACPLALLEQQILPFQASVLILNAHTDTSRSSSYNTQW